jgi:hypothetical protein
MPSFSTSSTGGKQSKLNDGFWNGAPFKFQAEDGVAKGVKQILIERGCWERSLNLATAQVPVFLYSFCFVPVVRSFSIHILIFKLRLGAPHCTISWRGADTRSLSFEPAFSCSHFSWRLCSFRNFTANSTRSNLSGRA